MEGPRILSVAIAVMLVGACAQAPEEPGPTTKLAYMDTVLSELGGTPTAALSRGQRWRMISSMGAGLPPSELEAARLPDPTSRGAVLVQAFCQRCHGLPLPQMHAAVEWPTLVRRMVARARALESRLGGPVTRAALGEILIAGMASAEVPPPADLDVMIEYLQANALPTVDEAELPDTPETELYLQECTVCHDTPSPWAHTPDEWKSIVIRMSVNAVHQDIPPFSGEVSRRITAYLEALAATPRS